MEHIETIRLAESGRGTALYSLEEDVYNPDDDGDIDRDDDDDDDDISLVVNPTEKVCA